MLPEGGNVSPRRSFQLRERTVGRRSCGAATKLKRRHSCWRGHGFHGLADRCWRSALAAVLQERRPTGSGIRGESSPLFTGHYSASGSALAGPVWDFGLRTSDFAFPLASFDGPPFSCYPECLSSSA